MVTYDILWYPMICMVKLWYLNGNLWYFMVNIWYHVETYGTLWFSCGMLWYPVVHLWYSWCCFYLWYPVVTYGNIPMVSCDILW